MPTHGLRRGLENRTGLAALALMTPYVKVTNRTGLAALALMTPYVKVTNRTVAAPAITNHAGLAMLGLM